MPTLIVNDKEMERKRTSISLSPKLAPKKMNTKDFKTNQVAYEEKKELSEYEKIKSRVHTIVDNFETVGNDDEFDGYGVDQEKMLSNSLKTINNMAISMEKHGLSRDDLLQRIVAHFAISKQIQGNAPNEEDIATKEMDEVDKSIEDADKVLSMIRVSCNSAQLKVDNVIKAVKLKFNTYVKSSSSTLSAKEMEEDAKNKDIIISNLKKKGMGVGKIDLDGMSDLIISELVAAKKLVQTKSDELEKVQSTLKESTLKIKELEMNLENESKSAFEEIKASEYKVSALLSLGIDKEHDKNDVGLEVHIEQSRIQKEAEMAKENLTKNLLKMKKIMKEFEELQKQHATLKEDLDNEKLNVIKVKESKQEMVENYEIDKGIINRQHSLNIEKLKEEIDVLEGSKIKQKELNDLAMDNISLSYEKEIDTLKEEIQNIKNFGSNKEDSLKSEIAVLQKNLQKEKELNVALEKAHKEEEKDMQDKFKDLQRMHLELEKEYNSLKKAFEKQDVELKTLRIDSLEANNLQSKVESLSKEIKSLKGNIEKLSSDIMNKDKMLEELQIKINKSYNEINAMQNISRDKILLEGKIEEMKVELEKSKSSINSSASVFNEKLNSMTSEISSLNNDINSLNNDINEKTTNILSLNDEIANLRVKIKKSEESEAKIINDVRQVNSQAKNILEKSAIALKTLNLRVEDEIKIVHGDSFNIFLNNINTAINEVWSLTQEMDNLTEEIDKLKQQRAQEIEEEKRKKSEVAVVVVDNSKLEAAELEIKRHLQKIDELEWLLNKKDQDLNDANAEINQLKLESKKKDKQRNQLKKEVSRLRTEIEHYHGLLSRTTAVLNEVKKDSAECSILHNDIKGILANAQEGIVDYIPAVMWLQGATPKHNSVNKATKSQSSSNATTPQTPHFKVKTTSTSVTPRTIVSPPLNNNNIDPTINVANKIKIIAEFVGNEIPNKFDTVTNSSPISSPSPSPPGSPYKLKPSSSPNAAIKSRRSKISFSSETEDIISEYENDPVFRPKLKSFRQSLFKDSSGVETDESSFLKKDGMEEVKPRIKQDHLDEIEKDQNRSIALSVYKNLQVDTKKTVEDKKIEISYSSYPGDKIYSSDSPNRPSSREFESDDVEEDEENRVEREEMSDRINDIDKSSVQFVDRQRKSISVARRKSQGNNNLILDESSTSNNDRISPIGEKKGTIVDCTVLALARAENDLSAVLQILSEGGENLEDLEENRILLKEQVRVLREEVMAITNNTLDKEALDPTVDVSYLDEDTQILILQSIRLHLMEELQKSKDATAETAQGLLEVKVVIENLLLENQSLKKSVKEAELTAGPSGMISDNAVKLLTLAASDVHKLILGASKATQNASKMMVDMKIKALDSYHDFINQSFLEREILMEKDEKNMSSNKVHVCNLNNNDYLLPLPAQIISALPTKTFINNFTEEKVPLDKTLLDKTEINLNPTDSEFDKNKIGLVSHKAMMSSQFSITKLKTKPNNKLKLKSTEPEEIVESGAGAVNSEPKDEFLLRERLKQKDQLDYILKIIKETKMNYTEFKQALPKEDFSIEELKDGGIKLLSMIEDDIEYLQHIIRGLEELTVEISLTDAGRLFAENEANKSKLIKLIKDKHDLQIEKDLIRKLSQGYGSLEMAEEIYEKERSLKLAKTGETMKKFEAGVKYKRAWNQLRNDTFLEESNRVALHHIKNIHRKEFLDHEERISKINEDRNTYLTLLTSVFYRVREIALGSFGDEFMSPIIQETKNVIQDKKWNDMNDLRHDEYVESPKCESDLPPLALKRPLAEEELKYYSTKKLNLAKLADVDMKRLAKPTSSFGTSLRSSITKIDNSNGLINSTQVNFILQNQLKKINNV